MLNPMLKILLFVATTLLSVFAAEPTPVPQIRSGMMEVDSTFSGTSMRTQYFVFYTVKIDPSLGSGKYRVFVPFLHHAFGGQGYGDKKMQWTAAGTNAQQNLPLVAQWDGKRVSILDGYDAWSKAIWKESQQEGKKHLKDLIADSSIISDLIGSALGLEQTILAGRPKGEKKWTNENQAFGATLLKNLSTHRASNLTIAQTSESPQIYEITQPDAPVDHFSAESGITMKGASGAKGKLVIDLEKRFQTLSFEVSFNGTAKKESESKSASLKTKTVSGIRIAQDPKCTVQFMKQNIHALVMKAFAERGYQLSYSDSPDALKLDYEFLQEVDRADQFKLTYQLKKGVKTRAFPGSFQGDKMLPVIEKFAAKIPECEKLEAFLAI